MTGPEATLAFEKLAEPLRREIKVHCYRMLGSVHEAEDAVQETLLRGWRSFDGFVGRGTFRAWFYRIATNVCLDVISRRKQHQRLLPNQLGPATLEMPDGKRNEDVAWLEPFPDSELESIADEAPTPEERYTMRQSVRLAFVALLQVLPPRQRAVVLLCDVLGWSAAESATLLDVSAASINSALQRARETLGKRYTQPRLPTPEDAADKQDLLDRYVRAWESLDVDGLASVLKEDAVYTMPPISQWYQGRHAIRTFFEWAWRSYDGYKVVPTAANGQPAFAAYSRAARHEPLVAHSIHVLGLERGEVSELTLFVRPTGPGLFASFGLPLTHP